MMWTIAIAPPKVRIFWLVCQWGGNKKRNRRKKSSTISNLAIVQQSIAIVRGPFFPTVTRFTGLRLIGSIKNKSFPISNNSYNRWNLTMHIQPFNKTTIKEQMIKGSIHKLFKTYKIHNPNNRNPLWFRSRTQHKEIPRSRHSLLPIQFDLQKKRNTGCYGTSTTTLWFNWAKGNPSWVNICTRWRKVILLSGSNRTSAQNSTNWREKR